MENRIDIQNEPAKSIFLDAQEIASPEARAAYLDRRCGADERLRGEVETLLRHHSRLGNYLEHPACDPGPTQDVACRPPSEGPGTVINPYKLLEQIGEGGMGVVYMAEQTQPVRRKVALKIIKPGMDTRQVIARFEAERQALALMDHPNIAKVLDAGATENGRPYFVMELVKGIPITTYCDQVHLSIPERLDLFMQVCKAVQHAHQKGIIHRDIKPSNVLVTLHDGVPVPKVIDFGVAKATGQQLTEKTLFTAFAQMVGTPLYMSPEQAALSGLDIDTRSDIYSLGVLLYELLTGTTPFDAETFRTAAYDEIRRIIREDEPPKPSTRLSTLDDTVTSVSINRHTDSRKLSHAVRGELDWIVMKALEKDRKRRYETANDFAADLQRHLTDQPVEACPPSTGYRLRKFVRRNKRPVAAGLALASLLVLGTVGTSLGLVRALRAESRAKQAETEAKEEAAVATAVRDFLTDDLLAQAAPDKNARNKNVTVEEVLGRAAGRIAGKFAQQPRIEAEIRHSIGNTYKALGDFTAAQPHLERAWEIGSRVLGKDHPRTLVRMAELGALYLEQGKLALAEPLLVRALEDGRRVLGEEHGNTLAIMNNLAVLYQKQEKLVQAEALLVQALEVQRRVLGEEHRSTLFCMNNLAELYMAQGKFDQAEPLHVKTLELRRRLLGEEHPDTLDSVSNLALLYRHLRQYSKAEPLDVQALEVSRRVLGEEHPLTLLSMNNLIGLYQEQGKFTQTEPLWVKALEIRRRARGEEHPDTLEAMEHLAEVYEAQGKPAQAEALYVRVLEVRRHVLGEEHTDTLRSVHNLGVLYRTQGELTKAEPLYVRTLEIGRRLLGDAHPDMLTAANNLANLYWCEMKFERSVPLLEDVLKWTRDKSGPDHPDTLKAMAVLAINYRDAGRLPEATDLLEQGRAKALKQPGFPVNVLIEISITLGEAYERAGQLAKAESVCRETLETVRQQQKEASSDSTDLQAALASNLLEQKKYAEAEPLLRECLKFREQDQTDFWRTFSTKSMLGGSLLGQKKYAEAEPHLLAGYEGMKQREGRMEPIYKSRLTKAINRLVQFYDATEKKDKADEWRKKLPAAKSAKPVETKKD